VNKHTTIFFIASEGVTSTVSSQERHVVELMIAGCKGSPYRTSRGELSLRITELPKLLAPCQHPFPTTLSDQETKIRNRHLDLWINRRSAETLRLRSDIIQRIRQFLLASGHREVQTPILADEAGGAVARPFSTFATEFPRRRISLRTAPELWLKRLVLGGFERVFEIGPCFRNEGGASRIVPWL